MARLLTEGVYTAAFPLREVEMTQTQLSSTAGASGENSGTSLQPSRHSSPWGPCDLPGYQVPGADLNPRQLLYSYWAC